MPCEHIAKSDQFAGYERVHETVTTNHQQASKSKGQSRARAERNGMDDLNETSPNAQGQKLSSPAAHGPQLKRARQYIAARGGWMMDGTQWEWRRPEARSSNVRKLRPELHTRPDLSLVIGVSFAFHLSRHFMLGSLVSRKFHRHL